MGNNPYSDLPKSAFWKTGVVQENPFAMKGIYHKKFNIPFNAKIATAGSCFAQHISRHLKKNGYYVLDVEPPPADLPDNLHQKFGYSMYSARYGNIYTVRQLLQLAQEVAGEWTPQNCVWEKNGKFYDALRPAVAPDGLDSSQEVLAQRKIHIAHVKKLFEKLNLFIFTLGLTEMWVHRESGTVYPTAPGTLVGEYKDHIYEFKNAQYQEIIKDFNEFQKVLKRIRSGKSFKILLTVSPVPLTATASGKHVLTSTVYSKSILRSVAGQLATKQPHIDYFPSYEIVMNPRMHATAFAENLRSVKDDTVEMVMSYFFNEHTINDYSCTSDYSLLDNSDVQCEESFIELSLARDDSSEKAPAILVFGNSHSNQMIEALSSCKEIASAFNLSRIHNRSMRKFKALEWDNADSFLKNIDNNRPDLIDQILKNYMPSEKKNVVITGMNLWGDGLIRMHGRLSVASELPVKFKIARITHKTECSNEILGKISAQISSCCHYLRKCIDTYPGVNFIWVTAPALPEIVARLRFGDEYVDSGSQVIYNKVYRDELRRASVELLLNASILISDEHSLSPAGFLLDKYANLSTAADIHASTRFYQSQVLPRLEFIH
ncbi:GSCFA domain-containing protein [Synechococcus sp. AH-603-M21]|nr:GSCFA domain-containing protein [Synechococcus sp. AH-603-M21]